MDSEAIKQIYNAVSMLVGVLSLVVAVVQTVRLNKLRNLQVHRLRQDLVSCRHIVVESDRLSKRRVEYEIHHPAAIGKIRSLHANACNLARSLFDQISQVDKPYNSEKLRQYEKLNIITSKWFWLQAALFVEDPASLKMPDLPEDTPDYMEGAPSHQDSCRESLSPMTLRGTAPNSGPQADA